MIRDLVIYQPYKPNPILENIIEEKDYSDDQVRNNIHAILEANRVHYKGLGIAANQISLNERAFNIDGKTYFNPKVVGKAEDTYKPFSEGCLSFLSVRATIYRPQHIQVSYTNQEGEFIEDTLEGLDAVAFQHELDHLNGVTMVDNIQSNLMRKKFLEKFKKQLKKSK